MKLLSQKYLKTKLSNIIILTFKYIKQTPSLRMFCSKVLYHFLTVTFNNFPIINSFDIFTDSSNKLF